MMKTILNIYSLPVLIWCVSYSVQAEEAHYSIDAQASYIRLLVYKDGALQLFGHNHVISHSRIRGKVVNNTNNIEKSRYIINLAVKHFIVDDEKQRLESGNAFASSVDSEDAQATKDNMLRIEMLDSKNYPAIDISGTISQKSGQYFAHAHMNIKGVVREYTLPIDLHFSDNSMTARGRFTVKQSDFGIEPFSLLGGMLAVQDSLDVVFEINASLLK